MHDTQRLNGTIGANRGRKIRLKNLILGS